MTLLAPQRRRRFRDPSVLLRMHAGMPLPNEATFARSSPATYFGADGILREAGPDVLPVEWLDGQTPAWLLERATTNLVDWSDALSQWSTSTSPPAVTDGVIVRGRLSLARLYSAGDGATRFVYRILAAGVLDDTAAYSFHAVRPDIAAPSGTVVSLRDEATMENRGRVIVTWDGGTPVVTASHGEVLGTRHLGGGLWRIYCRVAGALPTSPHRLAVFPAVTSAEAGSAYIGGVQVEAGPAASSLVPTAGESASRAVGVLSTDWRYGLRSMATYVRFEERGNIHLPGNIRIAQWGEGSGGQLRVVWSSQTGAYRVQIFDAANNGTAASPPGAPTLFQQVELLAVYQVGPLGVRGRLYQSIDGGPVTDSGWTSPVPADFTPATLYVGAASGGQSAGLAAFRDLLVLDGADWTMDAARRYLP